VTFVVWVLSVRPSFFEMFFMVVMSVSHVIVGRRGILTFAHGSKIGLVLVEAFFRDADFLSDLFVGHRMMAFESGDQKTTSVIFFTMLNIFFFALLDSPVWHFVPVFVISGPTSSLNVFVRSSLHQVDLKAK